MSPVQELALDSSAPHQIDEATSSRIKSWLAVGSISLGAFAFVTTEFLPVGLIPQIAKDTVVSTGTAGLLVTIPGLIGALAAPLFMIFSGQIDRRRLLMGLSVLLVVSDLVTAFAGNFYILLAARAVFGAGLGGFWALALATGARIIPAQGAKATAVILAGVNLATILGVPIGTFISELSSWRVTFLVTGALALIALAAQFYLLPALPSEKGLKASELLQMFKRKSLRWNLVMIGLVFGGHFAAYTYISPYLLQVTHIGAATLTSILLFYGLAGFVGNFATAAIAENHLKRAMLSVIALLVVSAGSLALFTPPTGVAIGLVILWGLAFGGIPLVMSVFMSRATPDFPEAGSALFISSIQISIATGSFVGGFAFDQFGAATTLLTGALLGLAGLTLAARQKI